MKRTSYQLGRVVCGPRKRGPDAWIFRYMEDGVQKAEHLGTTIQYKTKAPARKEAGRRSTEINERVDGIMVSGLCDRLRLEGERPANSVHTRSTSGYLPIAINFSREAAPPSPGLSQGPRQSGERRVNG